jgi:hypothetical protein
MSFQSTLIVMLADNLLSLIRSSWATRLGHESDTSKDGHERQLSPGPGPSQRRKDGRLDGRLQKLYFPWYFQSVGHQPY